MKRGVAGTLVFVVFNRDALLGGLEEHIKANPVFHRIGSTGTEELNVSALSIDDWDKKMTDHINSNSSGDTTTAAAASRTKAISANTMPVVADEIPPFDITVSMANEYGASSVLILYGCEILNEGSQMSVDNIQTQKACTFVARRVKALEAVIEQGKSNT